MDFLRDFFVWWLEFFEPQSDYYSGGTDWSMTVTGWVIGIFVMLIIAAMIVTPLFFGGLYACRTVTWYARRQRCQHNECGNEWTDKLSDGSEPDCLSGRPCCASCSTRHIDDAAQRRANEEPRHDCVHGHGPMKKVVVRALGGQLVMDRCDTCHGVWLDGGELDALEERAEAKGYDRGHDDGSSSNLAIGIAIGTTM